MRRITLPRPGPAVRSALLRSAPGDGFTYAHEHITVSKEMGTIAWFVIGDVEWASCTLDERRMRLEEGLATWLEAVEHTVILRGTSIPFPVTDWIAAQRAEYPNAPDPAVRDRVLVGLADTPRGLGARDPITFAGVRLTTEAVPRAHLGHLTADYPQKAPLAAVEEVRKELDRVTATMQTAGMDAWPVSRRALSWLDETSRALTHPAPELSDPMEDGPRVDRAATEIVAPSWAKTAQVVRRHGEDGPEVRHVAVRHVEHIGERNAAAQDHPWLSWFTHRDEPTEYVALWRVLHGRDVLKSARQQRKIAKDQRAHLEKIGIDTEGVIDDAIVASERAVRELAGRPEDATRGWGRVMVAVGGDSEDEAREKARVLVREARSDIHVELIADDGVAADVARFRPGAHIPMTGLIRRTSVKMLAAGVPGATWKAGAQVGVPLGAAASYPGMTTWNPFEGVQEDMQGLWAWIGVPGVGKSTFAEVVAFWNLLNGIGGTFYDPAGLVRGLCDVPEVAGLVREQPLTAGEDGILVPSILVPEPRFMDFDGDDAGRKAYEKATRSAKGQRVDLLVDAAMMCLPSNLAETPSLNAQGIIERAAAAVGGDYGTHSRDLIDVLRGDPKFGEVGQLIADQLDAFAESEFGPLVFPDRSIDPMLRADLNRDALGTIVTTPGLRMPSRENRREWDTAERRSVLIASLGAQYAMRSVWADRSLKWLIADEAGISTVGVSSWKHLLVRGAYDCRKFGASIGVLGQTPSIITNVDPNVSSLVGSAFVGRLSREDAGDAMALLDQPRDSYWASVVPVLPRGECVMKHWPTPARIDRDGNPVGAMTSKVRRQALDLTDWPESLRRAVHNRPASRVGRIPDRLRGGVAA